MRAQPIADAKSRYQAAQALKAETIAAKIRGDLIPVAMVEREWADITALIRAGVLAAGRRITDGLNLNPNQAELVNRELRAALGNLATAPEKDSNDDFFSGL